MKREPMKCSACMLVSLLLLTSIARSQQIQPLQPAPGQRLQQGNAAIAGAYSYILFLAPNKVYGYNIFRDGKLIMHQPATQESRDKDMPAITTKAQADKAAALAIEKLRRGLPAELSPAELTQATAQ